MIYEGKYKETAKKDEKEREKRGGEGEEDNMAKQLTDLLVVLLIDYITHWTDGPAEWQMWVTCPQLDALFYG